MPDAKQQMIARLLAADRAATEFRRGRAVLLTEPTAPGNSLVSAVETLTSDILAEHKAAGPSYLVLTKRRAEWLKVRTAGTDPILIALSPRMDCRFLQMLVDPTADLDDPVRGPFIASRETPSEAAQTAIDLCKRARLLPAAILTPGIRRHYDSDVFLQFPLDQFRALDQAAASTLRLVTSAEVPLADAPVAHLHAFRPADGAVEHLAIIIGNPKPDQPVLVRIHSECFTGDLIGSLRCDCGEQLRGAIKAIAAAGAGILLYLAQEGRGIGLINKLRAYRLQDQGFDTIEANERLGFEADERLFAPAAAMLGHFGVTQVRLLTNNPAKLLGLEACGIQVIERVRHSFPANKHNETYLATKRDRSGHQL